MKGGAPLRSAIASYRRHQLTDCGPNFRCKHKSPFGINQSRRASRRRSELDSIRSQFGKILCPQREAVLQWNDRHERL